MNDLRFAVRLLRRSPGYSAAVILVLGLGIAANLVAFAVVKAVALSPIPGVDADGLTVVASRETEGRLVPLSYPDFRALRDHRATFTALAGATMQGYSLGRGRDVRLVFGELVTGNYFDVLGVTAQLGRTLRPADETVGGPPVVVMGDALWRSAYDADPAIVGRSIPVSGTALTVVGVAAPGFRGSVVGLANDLFIPVTLQPLVSGCKCSVLDNHKNPLLFGFARRAAGVSAEQMDAEIALISARLAAEQPLHTLEARAVVIPLWESPYGAQTYLLPAATLLSVMAGLLFVVVCANVAGLVMVRTLVRQHEIAARLAVGAGRARITRQLFVENLVLAVPGAALGLVLPRLAEPYLRAPQSAVSLPLYFNVEPDWTVVLFALALSVVAAALYGLWPGLKASKLELATVMKDGTAKHSPGTAHLRTGLVVAQIAMAVLLLAGTALVTRSLDAARAVDTGFDAAHVATVTLDLSVAGYDERRGEAFVRELIGRLRADGITASAAMYPLLTFVDTDSTVVRIDGQASKDGKDLQFLFNAVAPGYFGTLGRQLVAGRDFTDRDDGQHAAVTIVNETFARRFFGRPEAALQQRIRLDSWTPGEPPWRTIVGVAPDMKYIRVTEEPRPYVYLPYAQNYSGFVTVHATDVPLDGLRRRLTAIDANLPVLRAAMLSEQLAMSVSVYDFTARALAIIGIAAIGLAAMGIYGLLAFTIRQRRHEIGVRIAIGADPASILRRFLSYGLRLGLLGAVAGIVLAVAAARLMAAVLFGIGTGDAVSFAGATVIVVGASCMAALLPAWRASRTDPLEALRSH